MTGLLEYNSETGRFVVEELENDIIVENGTVIDLHCGNCLTVKKQGEWFETRIEKDSDDDIFGWYFVGVGRAAPLIGHTVRIEL